MSEYPINSTARKFYTKEGIGCTLIQLIKMEPEWAKNRLTHLEQQLDKAKQIMGGLIKMLDAERHAYRPHIEKARDFLGERDESICNI